LRPGVLERLAGKKGRPNVKRGKKYQTAFTMIQFRESYQKRVSQKEV